MRQPYGREKMALLEKKVCGWNKVTAQHEDQRGKQTHIPLRKCCWMVIPFTGMEKRLKRQTGYGSKNEISMLTFKV